MKVTAAAIIQIQSAALPAALSTALFGEDSPVQQCDAADRYCGECRVLFKDADTLADHTIMTHATYVGSVQQQAPLLNRYRYLLFAAPRAGGRPERAPARVSGGLMLGLRK